MLNYECHISYGIKTAKFSPGFVNFSRSSFTLVVQLVQLGVFAFCIYAAMGM